MNAHDLRESLRHRTDATPGEAATVLEIQAGEDRLGVLPDEYRGFVAEFGWLELGHWEIFGLGRGVPSCLNVVDMTFRERSHAGVPGHLIVIMNDGAGNLVCVDSASGAVVTWWHDIRSTQPTAPDFTTWLVDLIGR
jgi:hypothetical protein